VLNSCTVCRIVANMIPCTPAREFYQPAACCKTRHDRSRLKKNIFEFCPVCPGFRLFLSVVSVFQALASICAVSERSISRCGAESSGCTSPSILTGFGTCLEQRWHMIFFSEGEYEKPYCICFCSRRLRVQAAIYCSESCQPATALLPQKIHPILFLELTHLINTCLGFITSFEALHGLTSCRLRCKPGTNSFLAVATEFLGLFFDKGFTFLELSDLVSDCAQKHACFGVFCSSDWHTHWARLVLNDPEAPNRGLVCLSVFFYRKVSNRRALAPKYFSEGE
jgi:hypothetical protein